MDITAKTMKNNTLEAFGVQAPQNILKAIHRASAKTGVNFAYMVKQAAVESSFNPNAKAKTSSATGLYQFLSSTWIGMIDKYGDKHGIDVSGKSRAEILELRKNPEIASKMAAEFASENERFLNKRWGGEVGPTELYLAHFMGAGGASNFLKAKDKNALQPAADLMPEAARANRNIFFDKQGRAKTIDEVYAFFDKKFSNLPVSELNETLDRFEVISQPIVQTEPKVQSVVYQKQGQETAELLSVVYTQPAIKQTLQKPNIFDKADAGPAIPQALQNLLRTPMDLVMLVQEEMGVLLSEAKDRSLF